MATVNYRGVVRGGIVVLLDNAPLAEGTEVVVAPVESGRGTAAAVLAAMENSPKVPAAWVDELEQLIAGGAPGADAGESLIEMPEVRSAPNSIMAMFSAVSMEAFMRKRMIAIVSASMIVGWLVADVSWWYFERGDKPAKVAPAVRVDPALAGLVELKGDENAVPEFEKRLEALAKKKGWERQLTENNELAVFGWGEARAELVRSEEKQYAVVILRNCSPVIPSRDVQAALLLDEEGKFLDRVVCDISNRLTAMDFGKFYVVIPRKREAGGAQLIFRIDGANAEGNFNHYVFHGGRKGNFYRGGRGRAGGGMMMWNTQGLCRVAIKGDKFDILFPREADGNWQPFP